MTTIREHAERICLLDATMSPEVEEAKWHAQAIINALNNAEHDDFGNPDGWCRLVPDPLTPADRRRLQPWLPEERAS